MLAAAPAHVEAAEEPNGLLHAPWPVEAGSSQCVLEAGQTPQMAARLGQGLGS